MNKNINKFTEQTTIDQLHGHGNSGIANIGNTCFLNTALQQLSHCPDLTLFFLSGAFKGDCNTEKKEFKMCKEYFRILSALWEKNQGIRPTSFKRTLDKMYPQFKGYGQHDSQEVLLTLLDALHITLSYSVTIDISGTVLNDKDKLEVSSINEWKTFYSKEYSKIVELFFGQDHTILHCANCNTDVHKFEPFCSLELPIPLTENQQISIYDCMNKYVETEKTPNRLCEKCNKTKSSTRAVSIWRPPNYLIISFKRFTSSNNKNSTLIDFPIENLNINQIISGYQNESLRYDLLSISNHGGETSGGHYHAFCKNADGKWYDHNDTLVTEIKPEQLVTPSAYVLIYKKK
tara:strand:- start:1891 stop:2931 length:1041 start_codon:yes stop_codon:yes gene_type:complete